MIYQRASRFLTLTFAALASSSVYAQAQGTLTPFNRAPIMTAKSSPPVTVLVDNRLVYSIIATDADTWQNKLFPAVFVSIGDPYVTLKPVSVSSMKPGYIYRLQGSDATFNTTWYVAGYAVSKPDTYTDVWTVTNPNPDLVLADDSATVEQIVFVEPKSPPPPAPNPPAPNPPKPSPPIPVKPVPPVNVVFVWLADMQSLLDVVGNTPGLQTTAMQNAAATGMYSTDVDGEISGLITAYANGQIGDADGSLVAALIQYEVDRGSISDTATANH